MTLPVELETSVNQLRSKHAALIDAVNAYRSGTIDASKQDLLTLADDIDKQLTVEEYTLLGQVARKGRMPSLLLDFANGKYAVGDRRLERFTSPEDILTFTRSTGGGRFNEQGHYEWVEANVPRLDYDPVTGECKGLLVEEQRTNLIPWSEDLTKWGKGSSTSVIPSTIPSPSGQLDAYQVLYPDGIGSAGRVNIEYIPTTPEGTYTLSWYVFKASEGSRATSMVYGGNLNSTVVSTPAPILNAPVGRWARVSVTFTLPPGEMRISLRPVTSGSGVENLHFWGFQFEEGTFPTSYIPTDGAAVTRSLDFPRRELGSEYTPGGFTLLAECVSYIPANTGAPEFYGRLAPMASLGTAYNRMITISRTDSGASPARGYSYIRDTGAGGTTTSTMATTEKDSYPVGLPSKAAISNSAGTLIFASGGAVASPMHLPGLLAGALNTLNAGRTPYQGAALNGHVRRISLFTHAVTESELQEITAQ